MDGLGLFMMGGGGELKDVVVNRIENLCYIFEVYVAVIDKMVWLLIKKRISFGYGLAQF